MRRNLCAWPIAIVVGVLSISLPAQNDKNPANGMPPTAAQNVALVAGMDQLCAAVMAVEAQATTDPAKKKCLKDAKQAMEKALGGVPQGKDAGGAEKPPKNVVLVDNTDSEWANNSSPHGYTVPEVMRVIGGKPAATSSPAVGVGSEVVILPHAALRTPPWAVATVLAHEGKRLIQFYVVADINNLTVAEQKKKECNEEEAYAVNLLVIIEMIKRLRARWDVAAVNSNLRDFLAVQISNMEAQQRVVEEEMKKAKEKKEKLGG